MTSSPKKNGRPTAIYRMSNGDKIDGLTRYADGRWKISPFPGQPTPIKFREADERLAVAKFHQIRTTVSAPAKVDVEVGAFPSKVEAVVAGLKAWGDGHKDVRLVESTEGPGATTVTVSKEFDSPAYWGWLHAQLVARAK